MKISRTVQCSSFSMGGLGNVVGRYKSPDEHPFFPEDLPKPVLPPMKYPEQGSKQKRSTDAKGKLQLSHKRTCKKLYSQDRRNRKPTCTSWYKTGTIVSSRQRQRKDPVH